MLAAGIFVLTYLILAAGRVPFLRLDRTGAALVGAVLMVATGALDLDAARAAVDPATLALLFGMMVIVAHLRMAGLFALIARTLTARVSQPAVLLVLLTFAAGILSALFVNDTVCLVFTPMVIDVSIARRHRPLPYLLALATGSNIGSVATMTGNPQNMLIGSLSGLPFRTFTAALLPVAVVGLVIDAAVIWLLFRHELRRQSIEQASLPVVRPHWPVLAKALLVTGAVLVGFLLEYPMGMVSMIGAAALLITRRVRPEKVYRAVDWDLLLLFVSLFVLVAGAERSGIDGWLFEWLRPLGVHTVAGLTATAMVLSNAISNVPAVMLLTKVVPLAPDPERAWLALAMSSTLAGNLTIIGSIANLLVIEGARRRGVTIGFVDYARVGVPVTLLTLVFGVWWLS
ncbi:MAG: anion transporter [Vicinamibacterales bacterium]